jgi:hypothetical protein
VTFSLQLFNFINVSQCHFYSLDAEMLGLQYSLFSPLLDHHQVQLFCFPSRCTVSHVIIELSIKLKFQNSASVLIHSSANTKHIKTTIENKKLRSTQKQYDCITAPYLNSNSVTTYVRSSYQNMHYKPNVSVPSV